MREALVLAWPSELKPGTCPKAPSGGISENCFITGRSGR